MRLSTRGGGGAPTDRRFQHHRCGLTAAGAASSLNGGKAGDDRLGYRYTNTPEDGERRGERKLILAREQSELHHSLMTKMTLFASITL